MRVPVKLLLRRLRGQVGAVRRADQYEADTASGIDIRLSYFSGDGCTHC